MGTYRLRVPASRVGYVPEAQGGFAPRAPRTVRTGYARVPALGVGYVPRTVARQVFLLTSEEPLRLSLDSFTRSTTEIDFQATDDLALQSWLDDLQYVCSDPLAAPPAAAAHAALGKFRPGP